MGRKSVVLEGFGHGEQPIPAASCIGPLLMTGGVHGVDRKSGSLPADATRQVGLMFENLAAILEQGGATLEDVARMTVYVRSPELRSQVNAQWVRAFPDEGSRPARHTIVNPDLPAGMHVQCDAVAFILK